MITDITIDGMAPGQVATVREFITKMELSWTMDAVSQLEFDVLDEDRGMLANNYFQVRRPIWYKDHLFEISAHSISQSKGQGIIHKVEARSRPVQQMKRDKNPEAFGGISATDYARLIGERFGLKVQAQTTPVKRAVAKASSADSDESVWDVLQRLASEAQFAAFEADGTLYFGTQEWLLGKWANIEMKWPSEDRDQINILECPDCRRSDDDPNEMDFRAVVDRTNGVNLRAGMTVILSGVYEFNGRYLITEVNYEDGTNDPVGIGCRTPEKFKPEAAQ